MLIRCQYTSWLVYIRSPFRLYMMPLMAGKKTERDIGVNTKLLYCLFALTKQKKQ